MLIVLTVIDNNWLFGCIYLLHQPFIIKKDPFIHSLPFKN